MNPAKSVSRNHRRHDAGFLRGSLGAIAILALNLAIGTGATVAAPASGGWPIRPIDISPRIAALRQHIESGDLHATDAFWQEALRAGTPLIEPVKDNSDEVIVTFVWRGDAKTWNVALLAPLTNSPRLPSLQLSRLLNTDLWYSSWQMKDDFRFTYRFAPDLKTGENPQSFATIDPLNPNRMEVPFEGGGMPATQLSIASMPRAPEERWIGKQADAPTGKVEQYGLNSAQLGNERKLWVYTPPSYKDKEPGGYGLIVLFDGFSYVNWIPVPTILNNLIHAGKIPPMIAVLIDNPPESRMPELEYNPAFLGFLSKELLPWIYERWNVTRDPLKTIVGGYSAGGAAAAFVAMQRPDLFGKVLSQSGSFWDGYKDVKWEWLAGQYEASQKLPVRFFLEAGLLEDVSKDGPTLLEANRHLVKILKAKEYPVIYREVSGTHEPVHWRDTFADGLISLAK